MSTSQPPAHPYDWTGAYVGGDGGYGMAAASETLATATGAPLAPYSYNVNGPFAGTYAGANYRLGRLVGGVEGDWQRANLTGNNEQQAGLGVIGVSPGGPFTVSTTTKDYGWVRARLGIAFDRFLVSATGGFARGDPSVSYALLGSAPFAANATDANGWTAGAGIDYAFTNNVLGRIECRYTDLRAGRFIRVATNAADNANNQSIGDMRVGVAYKFAGS